MDHLGSPQESCRLSCILSNVDGGVVTGGVQELRVNVLQGEQTTYSKYRTASGTSLVNRYEVMTDGRLSSFSTTHVVLYFSGGRSMTSRVRTSMLSESYNLLVTSSVL